MQRWPDTTPRVTVIELFICAMIVAIILGIVVGVLNAKPVLISSNGLQETWEVPVSNLANFQKCHREYRVVTMTFNTKRYIIVLEKIPAEQDK